MSSRSSASRSEKKVLRDRLRRGDNCSFRYELQSETECYNLGSEFQRARAGCLEQNTFRFFRLSERKTLRSASLRTAKEQTLSATDHPKTRHHTTQYSFAITAKSYSISIQSFSAHRMATERHDRRCLSIFRDSDDEVLFSEPSSTTEAALLPQARGTLLMEANEIVFDLDGI